MNTNNSKHSVENKRWMYRAFLEEMNSKLMKFINEDQSKENKSFESLYPFITKETIEHEIGYPISKYEVIPVYDKNNKLIEYSINVQPVNTLDFITISFNARDDNTKDMNL